MIKKINWVDRKFNFDFPVALFPNIVERLRGTPARVEEMIVALPQEILTKKDGAGWSIKEQIGHLTDLDELHYGRLEDYKNKVKILRPADMTNAKTNMANHNSVPTAELLQNFRTERFRFINQIEEVDEEAAAVVAEHPRLKQPMRLIDMLFFIAEHDDHHLAGITEISKKFLLV